MMDMTTIGRGQGGLGGGVGAYALLDHFYPKAKKPRPMRPKKVVVKGFGTVHADGPGDGPLAEADEKKEKEETPVEEKKRKALLEWFAEKEERVDQSSSTDLLAQKKADFIAAEKQKREEERVAKRVEKARAAAAKAHSKGNLSEFDYRETDDQTVLAWFEKQQLNKK